METLNQNDDQFIKEETLNAKIQRRSFLRYAGAGAVAVGALAACSKTYQDVPATVVPPVVVVPPVPGVVDLGSGDTGILNYAYALEQLEAAFYIQVVAGSAWTGGMFSTDEKQFLGEIRDHEVNHRELFKAAITAGRITDALVPDFSTINFGDRLSILNAAKAFEDTGVSAYNGAGPSISNSATGAVYLGLAGKIVSVEARHAAAIADFITPGSFAANLNGDGLDVIASSTSVLNIANTFLKLGSKLTAPSFKF